MIRWALLAAGLSGTLAVALGAFAAHALRESLAPDMRAVLDTAGHYHFVHTLAVLAAALAPAAGAARRPLALACGAWLFGIVVFSGSLYALAVTGIGWLGALTPIGGVAFLLGWGLFVRAAWKARPAPR